ANAKNAAAISRCRVAAQDAAIYSERANAKNAAPRVRRTILDGQATQGDDRRIDYVEHTDGMVAADSQFISARTWDGKICVDKQFGGGERDDINCGSRIITRIAGGDVKGDGGAGTRISNGLPE